MIGVGGGAIAAISRRSRRVGATRGGPLFAVPASTTALSRRGDAGADRFPFWSLLSVIFLHFEKNESGPAEYF